MKHHANAIRCTTIKIVNFNKPTLHLGKVLSRLPRQRERRLRTSTYNGAMEPALKPEMEPVVDHRSAKKPQPRAVMADARRDTPFAGAWLLAAFCLLGGGWPVLVELGVIACWEGGCKPQPPALLAGLAMLVIGVSMALANLGVHRSLRYSAVAGAALVAIAISLLQLRVWVN